MLLLLHVRQVIPWWEGVVDALHDGAGARFVGGMFFELLQPIKLLAEAVFFCYHNRAWLACHVENGFSFFARKRFCLSISWSITMQRRYERLWQRIQAIDLSPIRFKLAHDESHTPWSLDEIMRVEGEYRQFLFLTEVVGDSISVVPTTDIDRFWHAHILDTTKYAVDCDAMFGHFLHHFPYLGMRSAEDQERLRRSFVATGNLFGEHFGVKPHGYADTPSACSPSDCGGCDHRGIRRERPRLDVAAVV